MPGWKAGRLQDLLSAHRILMMGLVDNPGKLRRGDVGIYRENTLIHMAPSASQVPRLIEDLLAWLHTTEIHPLIASSVFHYEFEFIHPFADGNGRMGRLWQTLILSQWRGELAWLPVETLIHHQQEAYYQILRQCDRESDCTAFIEFMLQNIAQALKEGMASVSAMSEKMSGKMSEENAVYLTTTERDILRLLNGQPTMTAAQLAERIGVTSRTIERYLKLLQDKSALQRVGPRKGGYWQVL